jgi:hypothetical protein
MQNALVIVSTLVSMIALGAVAAATTLHVLMSLGMKHHDNYEYYGQSPAAYLVPVAGVIGFALPGILAWKFSKKSSQVSLGTLFAVTTLVALLFGAVAMLMRFLAT